VGALVIGGSIIYTMFADDTVLDDDDDDDDDDPIIEIDPPSYTTISPYVGWGIDTTYGPYRLTSVNRIEITQQMIMDVQRRGIDVNTAATEMQMATLNNQTMNMYFHSMATRPRSLMQQLAYKMYDREATSEEQSYFLLLIDDYGKEGACREWIKREVGTSSVIGKTYRAPIDAFKGITNGPTYTFDETIDMHDNTFIKYLVDTLTGWDTDHPSSAMYRAVMAKMDTLNHDRDALVNWTLTKSNTYYARLCYQIFAPWLHPTENNTEFRRVIAVGINARIKTINNFREFVGVSMGSGSRFIRSNKVYPIPAPGIMKFTHVNAGTFSSYDKCYVPKLSGLRVVFYNDRGHTLATYGNTGIHTISANVRLNGTVIKLDRR